MNTFIYDSSAVLYYTSTDLGSLDQTPASIVDNGLAADDFVVEGDYIVEGDLIIYTVNNLEYGEINFTETIYPFGNITIGSKSGESATIIFIAKPEPLKLHQKAIVVRKQAWRGSGTLFEIANGQERIVAPWVGSSGPLRVSGSAVVTKADSYNESSIQPYSADNFYGEITGTVGSFIDYGQVHNSPTGESEYGSVTSLTELRPFGTFNWSGDTQTRYFNVYSKVGSGSLFNISGTTESVSKSSESVALFRLFNDTISYSRTRPFKGSGTLFGIFSNKESRVYRYSTESAVDVSVAENDYGSGLNSFTNTIDYGLVNEPGIGDTDYGVMMLTDGIPYGLFKITGANSSFDRTFGYQGYGEIGITGEVQNVQFNEPSPQIYIVKTSHTFIISGGEGDSFSRASYIAKGSYRANGNKSERTLYHYNESSISLFFESNFDGLDTVEATTDYGSVNESSSTVLDLGSTQQSISDYPFGTISILSNTSERKINSYDGRGYISINNSAGVEFSEPLPQVYSITGNTITGREYNNTLSVGGESSNRWIQVFTHIGSGSLYSISNKRENVVYSYNTSSTLYAGSPTNYGGLDTINDSIDYGFVHESSSGDTNFGELIPAIDQTPFGLFKVNGNTRNNFSRIYTGSGDISIIGACTETFSSQSGESTALFSFSGIKKESSTQSYSGFGSFFNIGDKVEKATYSYNQSSTLNYNEPLNFGDFGTVTSTIDYGSISEIGIDVDLGLIVVSDYIEPYGLFKVSGSATTAIFARYPWTGYASIKFTHQPAPTDTRFFPWWRGYANLNIAGSGNEAYSKTTYVGSGSLFHIGEKKESNTYSYNTSSTNVEESYNYGNLDVVTNIIDYGTVTEHVSPTTDYGETVVLKDSNPFGLFKFTGEVFAELKPSFNWRGRGGLKFTHQPAPTDTRFIPWWRGRGGATIFNSTIPYSRTRPFIGSGSLFNIGDKIEKATYSYNQSSIVIIEPESDYGLITDSAVTIDYGYITQSATGETDNGSVIITDIEYPLTGLFKFTGGATSQFIRGPYVVKEGGFEISGSLIERVIQTDDTFGSYIVTGDGGTPRSRVHVGSGSLFNIGDKLESVTYDYNQSSVVGFTPENDYGDIGVFGFSVDYGYIYETATSGESDYGSVLITDIEYPLTGLFSFTGLAETQFIRGPYVVKEGGFEISGLLIEKQSDAWSGSGSFSIFGNSVEKNTEAYVGSGSLFNIGDKLESVTYDYNQSSVVEFSHETDYGTLSGTGITIDYGYITQSAVGEIDNGSVIIVDIEYPLTGLFSFIGLAETQFIRGPYIVKEGGFEINGSLVEKQSDAWSGSGSFSISGSVIEKNTESYVGRGSLFHIGDKVEKATYSYNNSSVAIFSEGTDYGTISGSGTNIDYGYVSEIASSEIDGGPITQLDTEYPFGLFSVNGEATTQWIQVFTKIGSGSLYAISGLAEAFSAQTPENTFLYTLSGSGSESSNKSFIGTGSLFHIGDKIEKKTYSYNNSSIVEYQPEEDYGFITASGNTIDYGSITEYPTEISYGSITELVETRPFGLFSVSGEAITEYDPTFTQIGSGTLFAASGAAEVSVVRPTAIGLFDISGQVTDKHTKVFTGSGSFFNIGDRIERATYSYNESAIVYPADPNNYGNLSAVTTSIDYGYVTEIGVGETDYGTVFDATETIYPYGLFKISGAASDVQFRPAWKGSGTLFAASGAAEAFSAQTPENTFLFNITGRGKESTRIISQFESGSAFISGNAIEKNTEAYVGFAQFSFPEATSGQNAFIANTESYSGSGNIKIFTFTDKESLYYRVIPIYIEGEGNLTVSGSANTSYNAVYTKTGSGTVFVSGETVERQSDVWSGYSEINITGDSDDVRTRAFEGSGYIFEVGGRTYSTTTNPPENTFLYTVSGSSTSKHTEKYVGSKLVSLISGTSTVTKLVSAETNIIDYIISGDSGKARSRVFNGSGYFSTVNGGAESFSANAPENTILYSVYGSSAEKNTSKYDGTGSFFEFGTSTNSRLISIAVKEPQISISGSSQSAATIKESGSGTLFTYSGSSESSTVNPKENTALYSIGGSSVVKHTEYYRGYTETVVNGSVVEKSTNAFYGSGTIFQFAGSSESSSKVSDETVLYRIFGSSDEAFIRSPYNGSGVLTNYNGASESRLIVVEEDTALFEISGVSSVLRTSSFIGSGSLYQFNGVTESRTFNESESTVLYRAFGAARTQPIKNYAYNGSVTEFVSGSANAVQSGTYISSGAAYVSGSSEDRWIQVFTVDDSVLEIKVYDESENSFSRAPYQSSGSLFTYSGSSESFSANAPETTALFKAYGNSSNSITRSEFASGGYTVSDEASILIANGYTGSGSLSISSESSNSFAPNPTENTILYSVSGSASIRVENSYTGSGTVFEYNTDVVVRRIPHYHGNGSLFALNSGTTARSILAEVDLTTSLFKLFGSSAESFVRTTYISKGVIYSVSGSSEDRRISFSPSRVFATII
jgi:hypothetical protein